MIWLACVMLLGSRQAGTPLPPGQSSVVTPTAPTAQTASPTAADSLPVSLDRIQRALAGPPPIALKEEHPVFRLEIFGRKPTIEDVLGEKFWVGATPYGGMTHQDFMSMVTPQVLQPYGAFTGKYLAAQAALTLVEQWALKAAIRHFNDAKGEAEREAARKEVLDALAALERARRAAAEEK
ncbi:MAG TPA: hypothetical protein VGI12_04570 [Vicinamibacterales bacterium]